MERQKALASELEELHRFHQARVEASLRKIAWVRGLGKSYPLRLAGSLRDLLLPKNTRRRHLVASTISKTVRYARALRVDPGLVVHSLLQRLYPPAVFFVRPLVFVPQSQPTVSIIIPVYNRYRYTYRCLASLLAMTRDVDYELIVVDDGSNDETSRMLSMVRNIKAFRTDGNVGPLLANNAGARLASGKYLLFLNNDMVFKESWLNPLVEMMERDPQIGIVGPKLIYGDGTLQQAGCIAWNRLRLSTRHYGAGDDPRRSEYNYLKEVDYIMGACLLIRRNLFMEIGGFSEEYVPAYYEDADLALTVRTLGYKVIYQPKSEIIHYHGITFGLDQHKGMSRYSARHEPVFHNKWKNILETEHMTGEQDMFLARDRSQLKTNILFLVHRVPEMDGDAQDHIPGRYILAMNRMGLKVVVWPYDLEKREPGTTALQQAGIEVMYGARGFADFISSSGRYFHAVIMTGPSAAEYTDFVASCTRAKRVFLYCDSDFHPQGGNSDLWRAEAKDSLAGSPRIEVAYLAAHADVIVATSTADKTILDRLFPGKESFLWRAPSRSEPPAGDEGVDEATIESIRRTLDHLGIVRNESQVRGQGAARRHAF